MPAVRADPSVGTQKIRFALRPRGDRGRPSLGTIVGVEGGPGFASTNFDTAKSIGAVFAPLLRRRELVLIDQRGTGGSQAVLCGALQRERVPLQLATAECANQLGPRAQGFTSAESAADIEAVRLALGLQNVILYGDSYGTLLEQAYAVRYGANLDGLILSSAYPADDPFWRTLYPAGVRALRLQCDRDPNCDGNGAARFREVLRRFLAAGTRVNDLLEFLLDNGGTWAPYSYRNLNRATADFLGGNKRPLLVLIEPNPPDRDPTYYSAGMAEAVECNDYPVPWDRSASHSERVAQLNAAIQSFPRRRMFAPLTVREWMYQLGLDLVHSCLAWPPPTSPPDLPVPAGASMPAGLPTLVIAGEYDDITSVAEARQVTNRFPSARLVIVRSRGHASELYFPFTSPATDRIRRFIRGL